MQKPIKTRAKTYPLPRLSKVMYSVLNMQITDYSSAREGQAHQQSFYSIHYSLLTLRM